jgi:hypothetical protein
LLNDSDKKINNQIGLFFVSNPVVAILIQSLSDDEEPHRSLEVIQEK